MKHLIIELINKIENRNSRQKLITIVSYPFFFDGLVKLYKDQKKVSR